MDGEGGMRFGTDQQNEGRDWVSEQCGGAPDIPRMACALLIA